MRTMHQSHPAHPLRSLFFILAIVVLGLVLSASGPLPQSGMQTDGEEVFGRVCATCHQVDRPTEADAPEPIAPPMRMIVRRYMMVNETEEAAHARIVEWLKGPSAEKSQMPAMAIEHHGLMPPVVLTEDERTAVATYVLSLHEDGMPGMQMQNGEGQGMQHQHGQQKAEGEGMQMGEGMSMGEGMKCEHMQQKAEGQGMQMGEGMKCEHMKQKAEGEGMGMGMMMQHGKEMKAGESMSMGEGHKCEHMNKKADGNQ